MHAIKMFDIETQSQYHAAISCMVNWSVLMTATVSSNTTFDHKGQNFFAALPVLSTLTLFQQGQKEIKIRHGGEVYRLRITRRNKLILQK